MAPLKVLDAVKQLPKAQDVADLQARMDCLLKENGELRTRVEEGEAQHKELKELKDRVKAIEVELKSIREDRDKAVVMARKFHTFMGYPGDIVNKARLYDESTSQPGTLSGAKVIRCMVDYSTKIEKLLREMCILLQPIGAQPEPASTTQQPTPAPVPIPTLVASPDMVTPPAERPDPTLHEAIPEINTEDIASLEQWAEGGLLNMATPTSGS